MNELKAAWEKYLENSDEQALFDAIQRHAQPLPAEHEYPFAHRIRDVKLNGAYYRVIRIANDAESVFIQSCETPSLEAEGVPYWLSGNQLQRWIRLETEAELDDDYEPESDTNWELFR